MPIYEFYCDECMTIFNFYSPTVNTSKIPACPQCSQPNLQRLMSTFATVSGRQGEADDSELPVDESKMEKALHLLENEMSALNADDPRQASALIRKMTEAMGGNLNEGLEEALRRAEAGEDLEKIEEEMGDHFDPEKLFLEGKRRKGGKKIRYDETLYDL